MKLLGIFTDFHGAPMVSPRSSHGTAIPRSHALDPRQFELPLGDLAEGGSL